VKKKTLRRIELLLHILTAVLLSLKAYDEMNRRVFFPAFIILGICILLVAILFFWRLLHIPPKQARAVCYYMETPALLVISYMFYLEDKESIACAFLIASVIYPLVGFLSLTTNKK
jgi:hypothetical protein